MTQIKSLVKIRRLKKIVRTTIFSAKMILLVAFLSPAGIARAEDPLGITYVNPE
ncbi:hypothetical protein JOD43_002241 [Pullulanibacillus pueri]|nr:hypothetical protein [Pullulanibacillus pueri]